MKCLKFRHFISLIGICLLPLFANAKFFKAKDIRASLGAQYSSLLQKRGIITYDSYQLVPIYALQLGNPDLLLAGSALYYTPRLSKHQLLRLRLNVDSTLDQPLYYTDEDKDERVRRESTSEFDIFYELQSEAGLRLPRAGRYR
jgi:hypothetical protein